MFNKLEVDVCIGASCAYPIEINSFRTKLWSHIRFLQFSFNTVWIWILKKKKQQKK